MWSRAFIDDKLTSEAFQLHMRCKVCQLDKETSEFHADKRHTCKTCYNANKKAQRARRKIDGICDQCGKPKDCPEVLCLECRRKQAVCYQNSKESRQIIIANWYEMNKSWLNQNRRDRYSRNRALVFQHYGPICVCCGETRYSMLAVDHVDNSGGKHRKKIGQGNTCTWLVTNGFPEGFQILCCNCNWSKHINGGMCDHEIESEIAMLQSKETFVSDAMNEHPPVTSESAPNRYSPPVGYLDSPV